MVVKYASQITALNAEIAKLDSELVSDPQWQALAQRKLSVPAHSAHPDALFTHLRLEQELARNPVYRARVKLLEAVQILQQCATDDAKQPRDDRSAGDTTPFEYATASELQKASSEPGVSSQIRTAPPPLLATHTDRNGSTDATVDKTGAGETSSRATQVSGNAQPDSVVAADDLMRIRGISRSLNESLVGLGVTRFRQIADWTNEDRRAISAQLGLDREISRQNWIAQAALLAAKSGAATPPASQSLPSAGPELNAASQPAPSASVPPPVPTQQTSQKREAPHVLIASAAHGLVRRLQAHNDAAPIQPSVRNEVDSTRVESTSVDPSQVTANPAKATPPVAPSAPAAPQAPVAPKLARAASVDTTPAAEPAPKTRRVAEEPVRPTADVTAGQNRVSRTTHSESGGGPAADADADTPARAAMPVLPKDKLRFRRLKPKSKPASPRTANIVPPRGIVRETGVHKDARPTRGETAASAPSTDQRGSGDARGYRPRSNNPLSPPPVPTLPKKGEAFKKRRWLRQRVASAAPTDGRPRFGDGQTWRQPDPVLTGPVLNDDVAMDSRIYAHTEEASVEIVRPRATAAAVTDPVDASSRMPSEPNRDVGQTEKTAESVHRHPAKRIFDALKRE